eukprot:TRINITY_DN7781_c3_g1_i1.p1 TRINITY_DN7781_c3_g1~~TRINITY_DN7781_c3_g1_i1.p1  ORF type:complete len:113 (-),score=21.86 TRINITY_DN7781_c3_g1_i1:514-852(-)
MKKNVKPKYVFAPIKNDIDKQGQAKNNLTENSEVEDKEVIFFSTDIIDQDSVNQEPQRVEEEQGQVNIEDFDLVSKEIEHGGSNCNATFRNVNWMIGGQLQCSRGIKRRTNH